jgi:hypothetical protein
MNRVCKKCGGTSFYSNGGCKPCAIERARKWHAENPDKAKSAKKKYADANRDKVRQSNHEYARRNKEKMSAYAKEYRAANLQKELERSAKWRASVPGYFKWYYSENKDRLLEYSKDWHAKNRDRALLRQAEYYIINREKLLANTKAYRIANSARINESHRKWRAKNKDKTREYSARWRAKNPEKCRIIVQNRRARIRVNGGILSYGLQDRLYKLQRGRCACCGKRLGRNYHMDHIMPIVLGGVNENWNIQLLRDICNYQKHAKHPIDFMQERGYLL